MSDIQISGDTVIRRPQSEPPEEDIRLKHVDGEPIHLDETGNSEQLRSEIRRQQREPDPITEWKASDEVMPPPGPSESHDKQIRRASESMRQARMAALGEEFARLPSLTPEEGREAAELFSQITPKVVPVGDAGQPIQPLRDDAPITEADAFLNKSELKRGMSQYRDWVQAQEAALLAELQQRETQQQQAAAEQMAAQQRAEQPAPQPPQPSPVEQERAALHAERQRMAYWQQISDGE